jgi:hypothetical protein
MTKKSSFLRQLNLYSFNRFSAGPDQGSYYHEMFLKGMKFLARRMVRQKVNGNRIRSAGNPDEEPTLSLYPVCPPPAMESSYRTGGGGGGGGEGGRNHQDDERAIYSALATMAAAAQKSLDSLSNKKQIAATKNTKFNGRDGNADNVSGNVSSDNNDDDDNDNDEGQDDDEDDNEGEGYASSDDNRYVAAATKPATAAARSS